LEATGSHTYYVKKIEQTRELGGPDCPPAAEMASLLELMLNGSSIIGHVVACGDCFCVFIELLRNLTGTIGPPFWRKQGLSTRTANSLGRAGILIEMDLWSYRTRINDIPGIGEKGAEEIARLLKRLEEVEPE
jgi:hypothetical protein